MPEKSQLRGKIIALSGIESSGKSTQMARIAKYLAFDARAPQYIWIRPGYTPRIQAAKRWLRRLTGKRTAAGGSGNVSNEVADTAAGDYPKRAGSFRSPLQRWLWLTTGLLDLCWTCCVELRLLRARRRTVLVDRYLLDAMVDFHINFPQQHVEKRWIFRVLRRFAVRPDAAFCLMLSAEQSLQRSQTRQRRHQESLDLLREKETLYRSICEQLDIRVLDATLPIDQLFAELRDALP